MDDITKFSDAELKAEMAKRKLVLRKAAWPKISRLGRELLDILQEHQLDDKFWGSASETTGDLVVEFFSELKDTCGGNDLPAVEGDIF